MPPWAPVIDAASKGFPMNILILGSGGREHALAWKIADSPLTERPTNLTVSTALAYRF